MEITRETADGAAVLRVAGDMDADTAYRVPDEVAALFDGAPPREVVVDLADVTFLDSVGLGMLVRSQEEAQAHDAGFTLRAPSDPVSRVLSMTAMDTHFTVVRS